MTQATQNVLRAFMADPTREMYGLEISRTAELATGTIHPILARLEACGWLESRWEDLGQEAVGRPRRRFYKLTPHGVVGAARALDRVTSRTPGRLGRLHPGVADGST
jgi:DNA-binding PadR family transcriptional regulator